MGFNVTSLIASLGIGGIALAFGAKETLSNLFGGLNIIADQPFSVGDYISCKKIEGTVQDIGFRSTKIKTFYDSVVTIPNALISDSIIDNLGKRQYRRVRFTLDITYNTPGEKIESFVSSITDIIKQHPLTKKDSFQCYFDGYGESSFKDFC